MANRGCTSLALLDYKENIAREAAEELKQSYSMLHCYDALLRPSRIVTEFRVRRWRVKRKQGCT